MFSNESIEAPVKGKPHICIREGWWRVSPYTKALRGKSLSARSKSNVNFLQAHNWVSRKNLANPKNWEGTQCQP